MLKRFVSIFFPSLAVDRLSRREPELHSTPFALTVAHHGRLLVAAASPAARERGVSVGMTVADSRAILPSLLVMDHEPQAVADLLGQLAEWCLRYTPVVALDGLDGLILEATGCPHLWGGELAYLQDIFRRLTKGGFQIRLAMAGTVGVAWAMARFGRNLSIIANGGERQAMEALPPAALRLETHTVEKLLKLGLKRNSQFMGMPSGVLRRRFGMPLIERISQALGFRNEVLVAIRPIAPFLERLASLEPIRTATGIRIAVEKLLEGLCSRMAREGKGLRKAVLRGYRIDGRLEQVEIGTNRATRQPAHIFKLFEYKLGLITPALGIELFELEAPIVEELSAEQEALWEVAAKHDQAVVAALLDRIAGKIGPSVISRYLPDEHYWPERSYRKAGSLDEQPDTGWRSDHPRPLRLLGTPAPIQVTVPIPDYPPMLFIHKGTLHKVVRADGPERIEQEWWMEQGEHRDYYIVEDEQGARFWIFRLGHYSGGRNPEWFLHGYFA